MLVKLIYKIGIALRNPSLNKWLLFLKESEKWTLEELKSYQLIKLKELIAYANEYSPYYQESFRAIDIHAIENLNDIKKIPILTKNDVIRFNKEIHTNMQAREGTKLIKAVTSGSSGQSLSFLREESADSFNRASVARGCSWYNVNLWDRNGYFWGFDFSFYDRFKIKLLDFLQNRFRVFSYADNDFNRFLKKLKQARYMHGYSSMIYQTSKLMNQKGKKLHNIRLIKATSEKIYDHYNTEVQKAFGIKITSEYGATESGIIAFECPEGHMHVNMEGVIVEEIDNEILVTNLVLKSFPIIRYQLGDYIRLAPEGTVCKCGMKHQIIEEVTGRVGANVYGKENIYPSLTFYYIFKNFSKNNNKELVYQVKQENKGFLSFYIEQLLSEEDTQNLTTEIYKYFNTDIVFEIHDGSKLFKSKQKMKSFISTIKS